jgi:hypothetical protein
VPYFDGWFAEQWNAIADQTICDDETAEAEFIIAGVHDDLDAVTLWRTPALVT